MRDISKIKTELMPYSAEYAQTVRSWIDSEKTYKMVCRGREFPPPEDVVESWQRDEISSYILFSNGKPVAYAELWNKPLELAVEIAHLVVEPSQRFKGFGTKMITLMYERGSRKKNIVKVLASLYGDSIKVVGCFLKAGFELYGTASYTTGLKFVKLVDEK